MMKQPSSLVPNRNDRKPQRTPPVHLSAIVAEAVLNSGRWLCNYVSGLWPGPQFVCINIAGQLPEQRAHPLGWRGWLQSRVCPPRESLHVWRERLQQLADDPQVNGIIVTIGDLQAGLPAIESLRQSLLAFRASGKRLIAFLVTANLHTYYLASVAETLIAPESAEFALHGLRIEATFTRAALDRLDVRPLFHHIAEYKSAANRLLYASMPGPQRDMQTALLESTFEEVLGAIAHARQQPLTTIRQAIDKGLLSAREA